MKTAAILFLFPVVCLFSCAEEREPSPEVTGFDFFPLETGNYIDYQVHSETYDIDGLAEDNYQLREQVVDSFANDGGSYTYIIYRYRRPEASAEWSFIETWSARTSGTQAIQSEGNIPRVKLSFPVRNGKTWDNNVLNTLEEDTYTYDSLDDQLDLDAGTFTTVTVIQEDLLDFVINQEDRRYERYARGVGLVEKVKRQLEFCDAGTCGDGNIESGTIYNQLIISYGKE